MEKQKRERIIEMIESNPSLKEQFNKNQEATMNIILAWLDAEEKGQELDPDYSKKSALEFEIEKLKHDLVAYKERGQIAEAEIIVNQLLIKRQRLALIGRESEFPERVAQLRAAEKNLEEGMIGLYEYKNGDLDVQGPTL